MIRLKNISVSRAGTPLLVNASADIFKGNTIGLVGNNGTGKSTLLSALSGERDIESGVIERAQDYLISTVKQETPALNISALDYVLQGHKPYQRALAQLQEAERTNDGEAIGKAHDVLLAINGYALPAKASELLSGLGFSLEDQKKALTHFSGGWRMRLNLAQALIAPCDLMLLDEPTNHLDLDAIIWLEDFLRTHPASKIIIAHDKAFLDGLCDHIWLIENTSLYPYTGNYSDFERQHDEYRRQAQAHYQQEQEKRAHLQAFVDRFRAKASKAKQAQSRLKALEKLSSAPPPALPSEYQLDFFAVERTPNWLVQLKEVRLAYETASPVLDKVTLSIDKEARIGLLGRNGAGKSTLMKSLAGVLAPTAGTLEVHPHAHIAYFAQHQVDTLNFAESPLWHMRHYFPEKSDKEARAFLGAYGFSADRVLETIAHFSGGEKARLALALLIAKRPNLVLLDEPTNHLDIAMREALTQALQAYEGAVVLISHDRHLLESSCDQFFLIDEGKCSPFSGDLDDYHQYLKQQFALNTSSSEKKTLSKQEKRRHNAHIQTQLAPYKKSIVKLEETLDGLNVQIATLNEQLADNHLYLAENKAQLTALLQEKAALDKSLAQTEEAWLEAQSALETLSQSLKEEA